MSSPAAETTVNRLALERRVEQLEKERRELWLWVEHLERLAEAGLHARGLAHDLGNALTAIMASTELASLHPDPEEDRKAIQTCLDHARTAAERLHTFVAYSRRDDADLGPVGVGEVLEDAVRFLAHPLRKAEMRVESRLALGARAQITHPRLLQVLTHALLTLIRGAHGAGGCVHVTSRVDGSELVVDLRRVASAATDPDAGSDWRVGSTGFELHLAREILERAGGRILGEPGDGLTGTVRIVVPVAVEAEADSSQRGHGRLNGGHEGSTAAWRAWSGGWTRR